MPRPTAQVNFTAPDLFGNDAAEDEDEQVFASYALERDEVRKFADASRRMMVVRAYKGEGKSALIRLVSRRVDQDSLVISTTGPSLSPECDAKGTDPWVRGWKEKIFRTIASELGSRIGLAFTDDSMSLVEEAEMNGFKSQSLLSALTSRIVSKSVPLQTKKIGSANPDRLVQRFASGKQNIWLLVDDVDQNFANDDISKARVASFFIACRQIISMVPELRIRCTVRPNVWTAIKRFHEALSHTEQYVNDLRWSQEDIRKLLAQRVEAYLKRTGQEKILKNLRDDAYPRDETLIAFVFEPQMLWGNKPRSPHVVLATLSRYRPRWVVELCKVSAKAAKDRGRGLVSLSSIMEQIDSFGRRRIDDTVAEFRSQCSEIEDLISAFANQSETYATDKLFDTINRRVLNAVHPNIVGVTGKAKARDVAAFLFQIGFLSARRDFDDGSYMHLSYADEPQLLSTKTNVDHGVSWEIHPVFRQALGLQDKPPRQRRR